MKKLTILLYGLLLPGAVVAQGVADSAHAQLSAHFPEKMPGAGAMVVQGGQVVLHEAYGMADLELQVANTTEQVFGLGSLTKLYTAVAVLDLVDGGLIQLDDTLTAYFPDYPTTGASPTIRQVLNHTGGLADLGDNLGWDVAFQRQEIPDSTYLEFLATVPPVQPPGDSFRYSNVGYMLLGKLVEQVSDMDFDQYVAEQVCAPAELAAPTLNHAYLPIPQRAKPYMNSDQGFINALYIDPSQTYAAGGLMATTAGVIAFGQALWTGQLVDKDLVAAMYAPENMAQARGFAYGLGLIIEELADTQVVGHSGAVNGYVSNYYYAPEYDLAAVFVANCSCRNPYGLWEKVFIELLEAAKAGRL